MTPKTIGRRRNGKQQACEPCRKSKQSCSHTLPHCDRCVKANKTAECFYHEAPMTKGYAADNPTPLRQSPSTSSKRALSLSSGSATPTSSHRTKSLKESGDPPPLPNHGRLFKAPHRWGTASSFGSTSFSAIFCENQDKFGRDIFDVPRGTAVDADASSPEHQKKLNQCLKILHMLPSESICDKLVESFVTIKDPLLQMPLMRAVIYSLWETFRQNLIEPRTDKGLEDIFDVLKTNEGIQWTCIGDNSFGEWPNICCGRQLRWEMLGLIFAFFGLAFMHLPASDPLLENLPEPKNGRLIAAWRMKECADVCLAVCQDSETLNETVINLMREVMLLDSLFWGNESEKVTSRRATLVQAVFRSGLYCLPKSPLTTAATEYRRRIFMSVYDVDKMLSCFSGQPPMMFQRHCIMQAPLDLSDEQLLGDTVEIAKAASQLDQYGWNTDGKIHEVTAYRARFELSKVKEEIQDISLRIDPSVRKDGVDELLEKLNATVAKFPSQLRYKDQAPDVDDTPGLATYSQSLLQLEYLQLRFHIERLRVQRRRRTSQGLFDTAKEMLETISHIFLCKDDLTAHWFDWLLVAYGFSAAGVLILTAITLLRSNSFRTPNSSLPSSMPSSQLPPSSQTTNISTVSSVTTASQPRNPSQILGINFSLHHVVELLNDFFAFLAWSREQDNRNSAPSQVETVMRKLTSILEQSLSQSSSQGPRSANSSFGGLNMVYPRSANSSFGGYAGGGDTGPSQLHSFDFNASLTTSGSASLGNTQLTTPTGGSFEGPAPQEYLCDGGYLADFDWTFPDMPGCAQYLEDVDFTGEQPSFEAPDVEPIIDYSQYTNGLSCNFSVNGLGMSQ